MGAAPIPGWNWRLSAFSQGAALWRSQIEGPSYRPNSNSTTPPTIPSAPITSCRFSVSFK
jgi:hypothetical protein